MSQFKTKFDQTALFLSERATLARVSMARIEGSVFNQFADPEQLKQRERELEIEIERHAAVLASDLHSFINQLQRLQTEIQQRHQASTKRKK